MLYLLERGPRHGYQLMKELEELLGKRPSPGTVYPLLRDLLREGLVEARVSGIGGRLVKTYSLTSKGAELLEKARRDVESFIASMMALHEARDLGLDDLLRELWELVRLLPELEDKEKKTIARMIRSMVVEVRRLREQLLGD
ncbi:PadR family transcriptional regulator [Pyrofollis japonicus]|nr:PadR family transcriptional regulator [Pyrofollis japonicus]